MVAIPKIRLKAEIPEALKAEVAQTNWGRVLSVTPVVMTVIATMLAGLSSSEMTRAQYERSLAAQRQSKAGDQWNFFQGKRLRSILQRSTLDIMSASGAIRPLDPAALRQILGAGGAAVIDTAAGQQAVAALRDGGLPRTVAAPNLPAAVQAALTALEESRPDPEIMRLLGPVSSGAIDEALQLRLDHALAFDGLIKPVGQAIDALEKQLAAAPGAAALQRDFIAARVAYLAQRYDAEARLNQAVAGLYELHVRKSNQAAERHHRRSQRLFYGMLAAQMAVIVSTLAMAAQKRSLLWGIAAAAGIVAVCFAVYVFLYV